MKEQEPKSRAQFLEERVANSCLNYQSKHGFDTAFDLILEDVIELRKMVNSVSGETPKPDKMWVRIINAVVDWHIHQSKDMTCDVMVERCKKIQQDFEKLSGEAKPPDSVEVKILDIPLGVIFTVGGHRVVGMADNRGRNFGVFNADEPFDKHFPKEGGSVPTPSDEEKIDVRIGMQLFFRKYKTGEEETAFIHGVGFGRGSAEQEKQQKS